MAPGTRHESTVRTLRTARTAHPQNYTEGRASPRYRLWRAAHRLALSDATATLASPWRMLQRPPSEAETLRLLIAEIVPP